MRTPDVTISGDEYVTTEFLGVYISRDPRFKLLVHANLLGLKGKKIVAIERVAKRVISIENNTYDEIEEFYFECEE